MTPSSVTGGANGLHPSLAARNVSKTFAGPPALDAFDLTIEQGEIHALVGENGSGKSTFIKILAGYHRPDPGGDVMVAGDLLEFGSAEASYAAGCRFVHQDLGLVATSSILDNLSLNTGFATRFGTIQGRAMHARAVADLARLGLDLDPRTPVGELSPSHKTGVAVARALRADTETPARLLVLDEPTATLPGHEVHQLLEIVRAVASAGVGVLYVTHRLDEVFELCHNATVLRDGRRVGTKPISALNRQKMITMLIGSELEDVHAASLALHSERGDPILRVNELISLPVVGMSFEVRAGDVVGFAGITGSGRDTVLGAVFGSAPRDAGSITVDGKELPPMRPGASIKAGIAYMPPDRKTQGSVLSFSARENLVLADVKASWRFPFLRRSLDVSESRSWFIRLNVRPAGAIEAQLSTFSGGNQQKVLFAKWLRTKPRVLMLDEPTQGVDVGAKAELHRQLLEAASAGTAVLISSSDVDELVALCHRILVVRGGTIVAELQGDEISVGNVSRATLENTEESALA